METILFTFEETGEEVEFAVLGSVKHNEEVYLLVVDKKELDLDDMTAYVIKAIEQDDDDVIYEIVDDDEELIPVSEKLMNELDEFDIDM
ncbi:MAG: DUF1292 domain-containing protein [Vallitalea sp.]|jgi:hypothetical protein|nr:DUF1292 domain-containing protein [Vallitalea sp.]